MYSIGAWMWQCLPLREYSLTIPPLPHGLCNGHVSGLWHWVPSHGRLVMPSKVLHSHIWIFSRKLRGHRYILLSPAPPHPYYRQSVWGACKSASGHMGSESMRWFVLCKMCIVFSQDYTSCLVAMRYNSTTLASCCYYTPQSGYLLKVS